MNKAWSCLDKATAASVNSDEQCPAAEGGPTEQKETEEKETGPKPSGEKHGNHTTNTISVCVWQPPYEITTITVIMGFYGPFCFLGKMPQIFSWKITILCCC